MLQRMALSNFKALKNASINVKPITILLGKNSSGKSSFLQSLLLLKQTAESRDPWSPLVPRGALIDLGSYEDFVFGHQSDRDISFEIDLLLPRWRREIYEPSTPSRFYPPNFSAYFGPMRMASQKQSLQNAPDMPIHLSMTFSYSPSRKKTVLKELQCALGSQKKGEFSARGKGKGFFEHDVSLETESGHRSVRITFEGCRVRKFYEPHIVWGKKVSVRPLSGPKYKTKRHELIYQARRELDLLISMTSSAVDELIKRIIHLGPIRDAPRRTYVASGETRIDVGPRGESAVEMLYADMVSANQTADQKERIRRVRYWLTRLEMANTFDFPDLAGSAFLFKPRNPNIGLSSNVADHGFGLSQTLPVIVQGFYADPGSVLLMEQPEIHLHPKAQASLADFIVEISRRGILLIIETHSEHLVERLQRLVGENKLSPKSLSILLFDIGQDGTKVSELKLTPHGKRFDWPVDFADGFFNSGLIDALRQQRAIRAQTLREGASAVAGKK